MQVNDNSLNRPCKVVLCPVRFSYSPITRRSQHLFCHLGCCLAGIGPTPSKLSGNIVSFNFQTSLLSDAKTHFCQSGCRLVGISTIVYFAMQLSLYSTAAICSPVACTNWVCLDSINNNCDSLKAAMQFYICNVVWMALLVMAIFSMRPCNSTFCALKFRYHLLTGSSQYVLFLIWLSGRHYYHWFCS